MQGSCVGTSLLFLLLLISQGCSVSDEPDKVKLFANYFFPQTIDVNDDYHHLIFIEVHSTLDSSSVDPLSPATHKEFHETVHHSDPWKAPNLDHVPFIVLHHCEDILEPYLVWFFNASLQIQYVPSLWKVANVVTVPKPNGCLSQAIPLLDRVPPVKCSDIDRSVSFW